MNAAKARELAQAAEDKVLPGLVIDVLEKVQSHARNGHYSFSYQLPKGYHAFAFALSAALSKLGFTAREVPGTVAVASSNERTRALVEVSW